MQRWLDVMWAAYGRGCGQTHVQRLPPRRELGTEFTNRKECNKCCGIPEYEEKCSKFVDRHGNHDACFWICEGEPAGELIGEYVPLRAAGELSVVKIWPYRAQRAVGGGGVGGGGGGGGGGPEAGPASGPVVADIGSAGAVAVVFDAGR